MTKMGSRLKRAGFPGILVEIKSRLEHFLTLKERLIHKIKRSFALKYKAPIPSRFIFLMSARRDRLVDPNHSSQELK